MAVSGAPVRSPSVPTGRLSMWRAGFFIAAHGGRMMDKRDSGISWNFFYRDNTQAVEQAAQRGLHTLFLDIFKEQLGKARANLIWHRTWLWPDPRVESSWSPFQLGLCSYSLISISISSSALLCLGLSTEIWRKNDTLYSNEKYRAQKVLSGIKKIMFYTVPDCRWYWMAQRHYR